jgi:methyl coenzyme M reductase gamma subunit
MDGSRQVKYDKDVTERVDQHLAELAERTHQLLVQNRKKVLAVAHALETYKTISGDDIVAVVEGEVGPIVDGTPYAEAHAELERYHEQALAVHEGRDKAMVLPLVGRRLDPAEVVDVDVDAQSAMRAPDSPPG